MDADRVIALGYGTQIPWDRYIGAGKGPDSEDPNLFVDAADVASIKSCSVISSSRLTEQLVSGDAVVLRYPRAILRVLITIRDVRVIQYTLTLLCDFLQNDTERRSRLFLQSGERPLFALLQMVGASGSGARITSTDANPYVLEHAARAAALIMSVDSSIQTAQASILAWVQTNLKLFGSASPKQVRVTEVAVETLMVLLRSDSMKSLFVDLTAPVDSNSALSSLLALLSSSNAQLLYDALHCLWLLSLQRPYHLTLQNTGAPLAIVRALRPGLPMKVLRVGLGTLVNLMKNSAVCLETVALVVESSGITSVLSALEGKDDGGAVGGKSDSGKESGANTSASLLDPELSDDCRWLREAVASRGGRHGEFSHADRYAKELASGSFHWTPLHTAQFWRENAKEFEKDGCSLLKKLAALLTNTDVDDVTLAVALFDAGEFCLAHPSGKLLCERTGLKDAVVLHLEAKRKSMDDVKQQALISMSKIIKASI